VLGAGMALALYDTAFATIGRLLGAEARPAMTGVTLIAGFGGTLGFPMGTWLSAMIRDRLAEDAPLNNPWLWPSPASACGHVTEPKEGSDLPSPHEYRHHARTMFIAAGVPYAESALLLGQRLPGASGGYVHAEHLVEHLRPHAQALEDKVLAGCRTTLKIVEPMEPLDEAA